MAGAPGLCPTSARHRGSAPGYYRRIGFCELTALIRCSGSTGAPTTERGTPGGLHLNGDPLHFLQVKPADRAPGWVRPLSQPRQDAATPTAVTADEESRLMLFQRFPTVGGVRWTLDWSGRCRNGTSYVHLKRKFQPDSEACRGFRRCALRPRCVRHTGGHYGCRSPGRANTAPATLVDGAVPARSAPAGLTTGTMAAPPLTARGLAPAVSAENASTG